MGRQTARPHTGNTKPLEAWSVSYVEKIPDDRRGILMCPERARFCCRPKKTRNGRYHYDRLGKSITSSRIQLLLPCRAPDSQGGYSGFQVTGMIECSKKSRPKKILRASSKTHASKSHANLVALKSSRKG